MTRALDLLLASTTMLRRQLDSSWRQPFDPTRIIGKHDHKR